MKLSPADQEKRAELIRQREIQGDRAASESAIFRLPQGDLLLGYQSSTTAMLFAGTALLVIEKSRRIGLTWGLASYAVLKASSAPDAAGQNVWYMGYDKDMTLEFIEVCAMWARAFNLVAAEAEEEEVLYTDDDGKEHGVKAFSIRFASGFRITALPSVPRALRGKQGIAIIDEAAFHKNVDEVIKAAMAFLIWGGQVIVVSTHDGISNPFNLLLADVKSGKRAGKTVTITFREAINAGLYERVALVAKSKGMELAPKEEWVAGIYAAYGDDAEEELDCVPKLGSGSLLKIEDIAACEHEDCGLPELYQGNICYIGRDVARRRDGQIQYCMELIGNILWQRDTYEEVGQTFEHQDSFFNKLFKTRRIGSAWIDQTGMGEKVVEDLQRIHGQRVHGELLTGPSRLDIALALQKRVEAHTIRIRYDPLVRADLLAIKKVGSEESGGVRIINDGTVHADSFWAYGLACRAADVPMSLYQYLSVAAAAAAAAARRLTGRGHPDDRPNRHSRGTRFGRGTY